VDRGATLIVLNPRQTKLDQYASFVVRYVYGDEVKSISDLRQQEKIGEAFTKAENAVILFGSEGLGLNGTAELASACAKLLQETGHVGKPNNGLIGAWERANDQGAWEMGYQVTDDLAGVLNGKAVYIVGANPAGDDPSLAKALEGATFVVVQDVMETATTDLADVLLPAQAFTELEGTLTSGERRVQRFYPAVPPTGESRPDFAITAHIADHMGIELEGKSVSAAFDQLSNSVKSFEGLNYARISETKPQWPIVGRGDMYYGGTTYENTMGTGAHLTSLAKAEETAGGALGKAAARPSEKGLLAVPVTRLYDRGTTVMMSANLLRERIGRPLIRLHPETSKNLGLEDGQLVNISFEGASGDVTVKLDDAVPAGVVLVPREMGLAIREPALAEVQALEKVQ